MSDFKTMQKFLDENGVTAKDMDNMWAYMYKKNWKVKNLTDNGKDWSDLNETAIKSLMAQYRNAKQEAAQ